MPARTRARRGAGIDTRSGRALYYVEVDGRDELRAELKAFNVAAIREAKNAVVSSAAEIQHEAKSRAPVRAMVPDYPISAKKAAQSPGSNVRDKIRTILRDSGLTASIGTPYFVARFVEFGTRKMPARPFLGPAFEVVRPTYLQRLQHALQRAVKEASS